MNDPAPEPAHRDRRSLAWLDRAACAGEASAGVNAFFVAAGCVITAETLTRCRVQCPVRAECVRHAYTGGPGGTPIDAGYFGGFSAGERRAMTLAQALARVAADQPTVSA